MGLTWCTIGIVDLKESGTQANHTPASIQLNTPFFYFNLNSIMQSFLMRTGVNSISNEEVILDLFNLFLDFIGNHQYWLRWGQSAC